MIRNLYLNTSCSTSPNNYDTAFFIRDNALNNVGHYKVRVVSVEFPNAVYPVNDYNRSFAFIENGSSTVLVGAIPRGVYTGASLASAFQIQMNVRSSADGYGRTYTVVYDSVLRVLTISVGATHTFSFADIPFNAYDIFGLDVREFSFVDVKIGDYPVNVAGTQYIDVLTNLQIPSHSSCGSTNVLTRVPVIAPFGEVVYHQPAYSETFEVFDQHVYEIYIQLKDDKNNFYQLPDNMYFSMHLEFECIDDSFVGTQSLKQGLI